MRLSLLDRSRVRDGHPDGEALTGTIKRAQHAEAVGYDRFWVAEHHAVPGIASGSPPVLIAALGARTDRIRLGSGGVMLPHHQPLVVAEQFRMLAALHPGRIDLGLGRSAGFTEPVRRALRSDPLDDDAFEDDLAELRAYLEGDGPVTARPDAGPVPMSVLATGRGVAVAARAGLPVVVGGPALARPEIGDVLAAYRADFRPHRGSEPWVTVSLDVTVADDDATAREVALSEAWAMAMARQHGEFPPLLPPSRIRELPWSGQVRRRVEASLDAAVAGSEGTVAPLLDALVERTGADELMTSTSAYDRDALLASDEAVRGLVAQLG